MTNRKKLVLIAVPVVLLSLIVGFRLQQQEDPADTGATDSEGLLIVEGLPVEPAGTITVEHSFTGRLEASAQAELGFPRGGRLVTVEVDEGEQVAAGDRLATLEHPQLLARRDELTARQSALQAEYEQLQAGPRQQTIAAARAEVAALEAQLGFAHRQRERQKNLLAARAVSPSEEDRTSARAGELEARVEAVRQRLSELEAGTRDETLRAHAARLEEVAASLERLEADIADCQLRAPFDGVVAARYLDPGTVVQPGTPVVRLVDARHLEARIGLPLPAAEALQDGAEASLTLDGRAFPAKLRTLLPEVDRKTRTVTALFDVDAQQDPLRLRPQRMIRLKLSEQQPSDGFWVPLGALVKSTEGLWAIYGLELENAEAGIHRVVMHQVEVLRTDGERALCRGTLEPGDEILEISERRVVAGQRVIRKDSQ